MSTCRDQQKARVYGAEQTLRAMYDRGTGSPIQLQHGIVVQLEPEDRFTSLADVQIYIDRVTSHPDVIAAYGHRGRVTVRERKGGKWAHYENDNKVIAINTSETGWALREIVILHELAHAFNCGRGAAHGREFRQTFIGLVEIMMGPQAALALRLLFDAEGAAA